MADDNTAQRFPDDRGRFGDFGGKFIPETLMAAVAELEEAYLRAKEDDDFQTRLAHLLHTYAGRPTALYFAENLT
ncbi:MAG TPA: tryptophan synthase subunit beta, partial [Dehalococcoidia bacterium]|nr:tryptophan synthase subunit beta [Dehalococcoidia bacterium]